MRPLRRIGTLGLALAVTLAMLPLMPAHAEEPDPLVEHAADGLRAFARATVGLGTADVLAQPLPATATSAGELVGLDAGFVAAALLPALDDVDQVDELVTDDTAPLGELTVGSDYTATITSAAEVTDIAATDQRQLDVTLDINAERTADLPLGYIDPEERDPDDPDDQGEPLDLTGGTVPVTAVAEGTFDFTAVETDNGNNTFTYEFWMNGEPAFTLTVDGEDDALDFTGRYGFTDIGVTGAAAYAVDVDAPFVDPNSDGKITEPELNSAIPADLFGAAFSAGAVDVALDFDSNLVAGAVNGTLTAAETDLVAAEAYPAVAFTPGAELAQFATITADDGLLGVGQTAVALRSMLGTADRRLPFLDGSVSDLYDPGAALFEFAQARANAAIVCGSADTQPPSGRLTDGGVAYCQAITGSEATDVSWAIHSAGGTKSGTTSGTVGTSPTANVQFSNITLPLDIAVTFTEVVVDAEEGAPPPPTHTVVPRFATAQEMETQLEDAGFDVTVTYDATTAALRYDVGNTTSTKTVDIPFDVGDALRPGANLTKVEATTDAKVPVTMTDGALATTFGIRLGELDDIRYVQVGADEYVAVPSNQVNNVPTKSGGQFNTRADLTAAGVTIVEDPFILEERFTIDRSDDPMITIGDISVDSHDADFTARIGMLPVSLGTTNFAVAGGDTALAATLPGSGAEQLNEVVTELLGEVESSLDLGATMDLSAAGDDGVSGDCCSDLTGSLSINWADVAAEPLPGVTPNNGYGTDLAPFDIRATVSGFVAPAATPSTKTLVDTDANFLTAFGIKSADLGDDGFEIAAPLYNTSDGTMCGAFTVLDANTLECDEDLAGGTDLEELEEGEELPVWKFKPGDSYEIPGDAQALRKVILESLVQAATALQNHDNPVFNDVLPFVELRPQDTVAQFDEVSSVITTLIGDIEAHVEERDGDEATNSQGEVLPAPEAPWETLGGLVDELETRLATHWCDNVVDGCTDPEALGITVALDHVHATPPGGSGNIGYLQLTLSELTNAGTIEVPLRVDLGDGITLTQPDAIEGADPPATADEPFSFEAAHASTGTVGIGIPLARGVPATDIVVLPDSGVNELTIDVGDDHVALQGAIGAVGLNVGEAASLNGTHHGPASATVLAVDGTGVSAGDTLRNLSNPASCVVESADAEKISCTDPMDDGSGNEVPWASGDQYVAFAPTAVATGKNVAPAEGEPDPTVLLTTVDVSGVVAGDFLVNDTTDQTCLVGTITPGAAGAASTITCHSAGPGITWTVDDDFSIFTTHAAGTYSPAANTTRLHDPTADFEAFGVAPGDVLEHVTGTTADATCTVETVSTDELVCAAPLTNSKEWAHGDGYRIAGVGILHLALDASLVVEDDPVGIADLHANLVGTIANAPHPDCDGNASTTATVDDACARLSLELQEPPEPEDPDDPATAPHPYLGIIDVSADLTRSETGGTSDGNTVSMSLSATSTGVLTDAQEDALGVAPLDWSLLPATTPYLAFLLGDALDGSSSGTRLPLIGDQLDAGANVERKLLELSSDLAEVGYDLDDAIEAYTSGNRRSYIEDSVTDALAAAGNDLLDGVDPEVTVTCDNPCDSFDKISDIRVAFTVGEEAGTGQTGFESGLPGLQLYADEDETTGGPSGKIETEYNWSLDVAFGIDKLFGPYIAGGTGEEFQLDGTAEIGDPTGCESQDPPNPSTLQDYADGFAGGRCIHGRFGLLKGTMFDARGDMASDLEIRSTTVSLPRVDPSDDKLTFADLIDGVETVPEVDARGTINLLLRSAPPNDPSIPIALPRLLSVFTIDYDSEIEDTMGEADWWHPDYEPRRTNGWTSPGWYDAVMDLGPFVQSILGPVLEDVTAIAQPLRPVIDVVSNPIPVISELHQAVGRGPLTMLDVLEQASGNDLTLLRRILASIQLAANLPSGNNTSLYVRLDSATDWSGGFVTQPNMAWKPNFIMEVEDVDKEPCEVPKDKKSCKASSHDWKNGGGKSTFDSVKKSDNGKVTRSASKSVEASGAGMTFPFLDDVRQVYGLFVGVDATLVRMDAGTLSATAGMTFSFGPFMAGPVPVEVQLGGSITLTGRFAMGYDTRGFRRMIEGEDPVTDSYLLDGMFIDDLDTDGKDVNEIALIVSVSAGASASLKIIKVGLEAIVTVTIGLNFNDPDKNGKLYLEEVMMWMENPVCLFDVKGTLEFVLQLFFEINLFVKKIKFTQVLYKLKPPMVLFEYSCSPPPPVWAVESGGNLHLNVGTRAANRGQFTSITNEKFTVRQTGAVNSGRGGGTPVEVTAFGIPLPYEIPAGGKLIAEAGGGNDTVRLLPGQNEDGDEFRFTRPAELSATTGTNRLEGGDGDDTLTGGSDQDVLRGGAGDDTAKGGGDSDALDGGTGSDAMYGDAGDDRLIGGPGRDLLHGGANADNLDGGPGLRGPAPRDRSGNVRDDLLDPGNLIVGGAGDDTINGGPVADYVFGDDVATAAGTFHGFGTVATDRTFMNTTVFGSSAATRATYCGNAGSSGTAGANTVAGHDGADYVFGGAGADVAEGGRGDDLVCAGAGNDQAHGGKGADDLWGANGDDRLEGGVGNDRVHGGNGRDLLLDTDGSNVLVGGEGPDQLLGSDTASLYVGDDLGVRVSSTVNRFVPADTWPGPTANLTATSSTSPTIFEASSAVAGAVTICAPSVVVIDGKLDVNADRTVDAADDGWFEGYPVIDGKLDVDRDGSVDGDDNSLIAEQAVNAGLVDLLGTGSPVTGDLLGTLVNGVVFSGSGNGDCVLAGTGADRLHGVDGGDHIDAGDGADYLEGNRGDDFVRGSLGDDTAFGGDGADDMYGDSGREAMYGGAGADELFGGPGNDYAEGNQGNDALTGGSEDDVLLGGSSNRTHPSTRSATATVETPDGDDVVNGDDGSDLAFGDNVNFAAAGAWQFGTAAGHGDDRVSGGSGDDVLLGQLGTSGPPQDRVDGGDGHDYAFGDLATIALPNGRWTTPPGWHSLSFPTAATSSGASHWPGGAPKYTVTLATPDSGGPDIIRGEGGDDHVYAGAGADAAEGGYGDDYIEGNGGGDTIFGLAEDDPAAAATVAAILSTPSDQDVILGGSSPAHALVTAGGSGAGAPDTGDVIRGNLAQDVIVGDNGTVARTVTGSAWATDAITGGHARTVTLNDRSRTTTLAAVSGDDIALGDEGNDRIFGTGGNDHLRGNDDQDAIEGNQGKDWLEGNAHADDLIGGSSCAAGEFTCTGDADLGDLLFGGAGQDVATGDNAVIKRTPTGGAYLTTTGRLLGFSPHRWVQLLDPATADPTKFGSDRVSGGTEDDVLFGQSGNDWIAGGAGADYAEGNTGSDGIFGDRLLSAVGNVTKVRERFNSGTTEADVLTVPTALRAVDTKAGTLGLTKRLNAQFRIDTATLAELEGTLANSTDEGQLDGQDDLVGGSRVGGTADFNDLIWGDGEADAMTGDNANITKTISAGAYKLHTTWYEDGTTTLPSAYGQRNLAIERVTNLFDDANTSAVASSATNAWGDDYMDGGDGEDFMQGQDGHDDMWGSPGNDVMAGRVGNDKMYGGLGDDAMLGARGDITRTYINAGDAAFPTTELSYSAPPFLTYQRFVVGRLHHQVTVPTTGATTTATQQFDGDDLVRGGPGMDTLHGGAGADRMNGDSGGDVLFGGDANDAMWGGRGDAAGTADRGTVDDLVDYLYGGYGGDKLDYRPQAQWATSTDARLQTLYAQWTEATKSYSHPDGDVQEPSTQDHQGVDWIYGGFNADVLQANVSQTGPNDGDRLIDWTGAFNLYTACPADYGGYNHVRAMSPGMIDFLEQLAYTKGAGSLADVRAATNPAYRNVGLVYTKDSKANSGTAYTDEFGKTPGHLFEKGITCG